MKKAVQLALDLGPADHFWALHGRTRQRVAVGAELPDHPLNVRTLPKGLALKRVVELPSLGVGAHLSQNTFGRHRCLDDLAELGALYVDLDVHERARPEYRDLDADALLSAILKTYPSLPHPTLWGTSGQGVHGVWCFWRPLPADKLHLWQHVQDTLVDALAPFGADPAARDATRLLRVSGSPNFSAPTARHALIRRVADPVPFGGFREFVREYHQAHHTEGDRTPGKVLWTPYRLAAERRADLLRLAELRAPMKEARKRFLYVYAAVLAWFLGSPDDVLRELNEAARAYFFNGVLYAGKVARNQASTVLKRMEKALQGGQHEWRGMLYDPRYRFRNSTIIRLLEITPQEMRELRTLINTAEKRRRKNERDAARKRAQRRAAGVAPREQYEAERKARVEALRQRARDLWALGWPQTKIAAELGVSRRRVGQLLRGGGNGVSPLYEKTL